VATSGNKRIFVENHEKEHKLRSNWQTFSESAKTFLAKAEACQKASDAQTFYELAEKSSRHALEIWIELESNSILLFIQAGSGPYSAYSDFCSRNGLELLDEGAFDCVLTSL
jgi:hypothetical protein